MRVERGSCSGDDLAAKRKQKEGRKGRAHEVFNRMGVASEQYLNILTICGGLQQFCPAASDESLMSNLGRGSFFSNNSEHFRNCRKQMAKRRETVCGLKENVSLSVGRNCTRQLGENRAGKYIR